MKKSSGLLEFLIIGIVGTLWHFIYEWSGNNVLIGIIAPINESVWEHLKLLFFPTVIYSVIEYIILKDRPENYISASAIGLFAGLFAIVAFFYTYTGILGYNLSVIDILSYFIGLFIMLIIKKRILRKNTFCSKNAKYFPLFFVILLAVLFGLWTFNPLSIGIFTPPVM